MSGSSGCSCRNDGRRHPDVALGDALALGSLGIVCLCMVVSTMSEDSEKLPERRRTPIETHIQTILVTVSTAAILFLANFSYDTSRGMAAMQSDLKALPAIYALKQELAIEADKRRDLEVEMARLRERVERGYVRP